MSQRVRPALALMLSLLAACGGQERAASDEATASLGDRGAAAPAAPPMPAPQMAARAADGMTSEGLALAEPDGREAAKMGVTGAGATAGAMRADATEAAGGAGASAAQLPGSGGAALAQGEAPAMVIRTGVASVEVDSLELAVEAARAAAGRLGGWVANAAVQGGREQVRSATLQLKVPAARFDALTGTLGALGKLERLDVTADDVGEEFVDVSARVANARRLEDRLLALLERSAGRLSDVLAVERELARVREEIERYEGRLRFLRTRAATSTLTLTLHEPVPLVSSVPGRSPIADAVRQAWRNFVGFVAAVIASLGVLVPLAAIAFALYAAVRPLRRRRGGTGTPPSATPPSATPPSATPPSAERPPVDRAA